ncbi:MAG: agmatine deiminase family protein [Thalassospira sp.]|nr:agmatine deiminase family protein [Thalassospira sp.]
MTTPRFTMPAEWERHSRTWLAWPHQRRDWPGKFAPVPWVFAEIARLITLSERLGLVVRDIAAKAEAEEILSLSGVNLELVDFVIAATDRGWLRDCGAIFVRDAAGRKTALRFGFTGWAKYRNHKKDAALPVPIAAAAGVALVEAGFVLEGGGIDVNGAGCVLTTEEWLLSDKQIRNKGFTREKYEALFAEYLGAPHTIWLGNGIVGDDTHGHVDDLARFVSADTIVCVREQDRTDANFAALEDNWARLSRARDAAGKQFTVAALPMPRPVLFEGERLPASYANFLITNGHVLVPLFNDPADREALNVLAACFPGRDVVGLYARDLVLGLGTVHCLTQQESA